MIDHIVDLSARPARLSIRYGQLVVESPEAAWTVPLAEVAVLIVANPQVSLTQAVLAGLTEQGGVCVVCDGASRPTGLLFPLVQHHRQTERLAAQAAATLPLRKRLWRQIVRQKIAAQAAALETIHRSDFGLRMLIPAVRSGDRSNVEARASQRYWKRLFGDAQFRRDPDRPDQNRFLNYGYAVLRAMTARAICAAGLHPSLGLHHHNRYNPFCLADDLMEPFRPLVDLQVVRLLATSPPTAEMTPEVKKELLGFVQQRLNLDGERRSVFDCLSRLAVSLAEVFLKQRSRLFFPQWHDLEQQ